METRMNKVEQDICTLSGKVDFMQESLEKTLKQLEFYTKNSNIELPKNLM